VGPWPEASDVLFGDTSHLVKRSNAPATRTFTDEIKGAGRTRAGRCL
jgi:hypothetical protein